MATASGVRRIGERVERKDLWWIEPLIYVVVLGGFVVYATWASLVNGNYYAEPYLSPFYSPCLAQNCVHPTLPLLGSWWNLSPAILIVGSPLAFRLTCYYYRRSYYRGFFLSPPACLVPDGPKKYSGETRFPFIIQNFHRYALYLALVVLVVLVLQKSGSGANPVLRPVLGRHYGPSVLGLACFSRSMARRCKSS